VLQMHKEQVNTNININKLCELQMNTHVTEGGSDPVGSKKFRSDPTEFLSEFDGT
jgi:hypothetical protein